MFPSRHPSPPRTSLPGSRDGAPVPPPTAPSPSAGRHLAGGAPTPILGPLLLALTLPLPLSAQINGEAGEEGLRPVPTEEYARWERPGATDLSPDGGWLAVQISRVDGDGELRIRPVSNPDSVVVVPNGSTAEFTDDGRRILYMISVSEEERERLRDQDRPVRTRLGIFDLETGEEEEVADVTAFALSPDGRWVVLRKNPPEGRRDARGVDIVVRTLATGVEVPFGNIFEYRWQDEGSLLALIVDAEGRTGNGVLLWDPETRRIHPLLTEPVRFSNLAWREESADLAVMAEVDREGEDEEAFADTTVVVHLFQGLDREGAGEELPTPTTLDGSIEGLPPGYGLAPWGAIDFLESPEGAPIRIAVELRERIPAPPACEGAESQGVHRRGEGEERAPSDPAASSGADTLSQPDPECEESDEEAPTVEIWHAGDVDIVPTQKLQANRERRETETALWHLNEARLVRLEDGVIDDIDFIPESDLAIGTDGTPWDRERMFGPVYEDIHLVDVTTGEREKLLERKEYFFGASPGARYLLWFEEDHYWTLDLETRETRNITAGLDGVFVDLEDDHTVEQKPPFRTAGWLEDDAAVLIYDRHDIWRVRPDGSGGERITDGAPRNLRHRYTRIDPEADVGAAIDPEEEIWFSLYDDWGESSGYARADRVGGEVELLLLEEARVSSLARARDADRFVWRIEDFEDSPDLFVGDAKLEGRQITRTNPFQDDYLWGTSELVSYTNEWGDTLQGALYYPAGYEPGRRYPMITYIYEIRSNTVRSYQIPSTTDYYNFQHWVQDGYFVFQPDIVYRDRDPGVSAVVNIVPAVEAVLERGEVDPDRIGLIGHSWGGYQTTFFVTQSDLFAAAVAGAPLTNMFSMYLSIYWNTGGTDARIFEISQGRLEVPFWEDEAAYRRNSPVFHIEQMRTPLLMAQGSEDGAVDFNQGVEFYNAARRAGKDFVFLVYNDENHGFAAEPNRRDYHRRINEWFAHYLKGEPAPAWITEGLPWLDQPGGTR